MSNNLYWPVYMNLERELNELSSLIHIDDKQLEVYSIRIAELLIRTVVEIESISKELYFQNGGLEPKKGYLKFDTDCLNLLESKWLLSQKEVLVSGLNFHFENDENKTLTPFLEANIYGKCNWKTAYQAVKHNRNRDLEKGNLMHLIRAMAALYVLNLYYKDTEYKRIHPDLKDSYGSFGSMLFSVTIHNQRVSYSSDKPYLKNENFDKCVYLLNTSEETIKEMDSIEKKIDKEVANRLPNRILEFRDAHPEASEEVSQQVANSECAKIRSQVRNEHVHSYKRILTRAKYELILNKNQY